ncbi:MAG: ATP-binding cassette domain-containing protein [Rhizobiales bacterium]|nr:ATP-binding cassette domain-containing protein [Hyphomicrobiales bacterium]NRB15536.1 ATP-binding cassette domain-containing protein [Hyphomicrobiales bacterium]
MGTLKLKNISKSFGNVEVLRDISLEVADGEFVIFVGPSGCGKSTLLRIIAGLEDATKGEVIIDGQMVNHLGAADRGISMVFQSYALYPHMTVEANMGLGLKQAKTPKAEIKARVTKAANMLELTPLLNRRPAELSGGQRQRVAIGRSIVREPKIFLFDEPLSNLDAALRVNTRIEIANLHNSLNSSMIYVTHDQVEAMTLADKIVVLHDGKIEQIGHPIELYNHPCNMFVAGFIGSPKMNFFDADKLDVKNAITVGVRPEHIKIDAKQGDYECEITYVEHLGSDSNLYLTHPKLGAFTVRVFGQVAYARGETLHASLLKESMHKFDEHENVITDI